MSLPAFTFRMVSAAILITLALVGCDPAKNQPTAQTTPRETVQLSWPDRSGWTTRSLDVLAPGLLIDLPAEVKAEAYKEQGMAGVIITLANGRTEHIKLANTLETFEMREERHWLENSEARENLVWIVDKPDLAYYTGHDLSAPDGHQTTHSCYGFRKLGDLTYFMNVDGIQVEKGQVSQLTQADCLILLSALESLRLGKK